MALPSRRRPAHLFEEGRLRCDDIRLSSPDAREWQSYLDKKYHHDCDHDHIINSKFKLFTPYAGQQSSNEPSGRIDQERDGRKILQQAEWYNCLTTTVKSLALCGSRTVTESRDRNMAVNSMFQEMLADEKAVFECEHQSRKNDTVHARIAIGEYHKQVLSMIHHRSISQHCLNLALSILALLVKAEIDIMSHLFRLASLKQQLRPSFADCKQAALLKKRSKHDHSIILTSTSLSQSLEDHHNLLQQSSRRCERQNSSLHRCRTTSKPRHFIACHSGFRLLAISSQSVRECLLRQCLSKYIQPLQSLSAQSIA
ncbi:hypothetical protein MRB53_038857 [Persea americana]|nr:hypothetical protein MRB53_038857 [Persea americana]